MDSCWEGRKGREGRRSIEMIRKKCNLNKISKVLHGIAVHVLCMLSRKRKSQALPVSKRKFAV